VEETRRTLQQFREAIHSNRVAYPSPTPTFPRQCRAEIQWRVAELFLVNGWTCTRLSARYGVTRSRIWWFVRSWIDRALALGYLQDIPPEGLSAVAASQSSELGASLPAACKANNSLSAMNERGPWAYLQDATDSTGDRAGNASH